MSDTQNATGQESSRPDIGPAMKRWHARSALIGVALGTLAGAGLALLCVPASRTYLNRRAVKGLHRANAALRQGVRSFEGQRKRFAEALDVLWEVVEDGRTRWQRAQGHAGQAFAEGREAASRIVKHGRKAADEIVSVIR